MEQTNPPKQDPQFITFKKIAATYNRMGGHTTPFCTLSDNLDS